jgi:hypothetical protein
MLILFSGGGGGGGGGDIVVLSCTNWCSRLPEKEGVGLSATIKVVYK